MEALIISINQLTQNLEKHGDFGAGLTFFNDSYIIFCRTLIILVAEQHTVQSFFIKIYPDIQIIQIYRWQFDFENLEIVIWLEIGN